MAKIIEFSSKTHSKTGNAFENLIKFFDVVDTVKGCEFFLEAAEVCYKNEYISLSELYTLRRIGRQKRDSLNTMNAIQ